MQQPQTHHQIVEEILPEQMSDEVTKEVINQFLPQRKRKPRVSKAPGKQNPSKIIKLEPQASGSEQTITEISNIVETSTEEMIIEKQEQVTEMIEEMGEEQAEQSSTDVKVKGEGKASKDKSSSKKTRDIKNHLLMFCCYNPCRTKIKVTIGTTGDMPNLFCNHSAIAQLEETFGVETFQETHTEEVEEGNGKR